MHVVRAPVGVGARALAGGREQVDPPFVERAPNREAALRAYVEELLASPAYGERWAVPWLDLARYADSKGYESDRFRDMWRYRDWVVDALNADVFRCI